MPSVILAILTGWGTIVAGSPTHAAFPPPLRYRQVDLTMTPSYTVLFRGWPPLPLVPPLKELAKLERDDAVNGTYFAGSY